MASSAIQQEILSGPAIEKAGTSSANGFASSRGPALQIDGGSELGSYVIATYGVDRTSPSPDVTARFTVRPVSGASFLYILVGSGPHYAGKQLRLERRPGSDQLQADVAPGPVPCGVVASGVPTAVSLVFDTTSRTFTVLFGDEPTECTNLPTALQPPIVGFDLMDASNEGYGGQVTFSDLALQPGPPAYVTGP